MLDLRGKDWREIRLKRVERPMTLSDLAQQQTGKTVARSNLVSLLEVKGSSKPVLSDKPAERDCQPFKQEVFRSEALKALHELRASGQPDEVLAKLSSFEAPSPGVQAEELCQLLVEVVQEGSQEVRRQGFEVIIKLVGSKDWSVESLSSAVGLFLSEQAPDLVCDVPALPKILGELHSQLCMVKGMSPTELGAMKRLAVA